MKVRSLAWCLALGAACVPLYAASQATPREIITRNASGPVIVWDATPQIEALIAQNIPYDKSLDQLKIHALELFVQGAHGFAKKETHLSVMVVYARSGAINSRYQTKSFQGVGDVLTLEGSPHIRLDSQWRAQAQHGQLPAGLTLHVSPPPASEGQ
jgi:hypothetical protein